MWIAGRRYRLDRLILASCSPRRCDLLKRTGIPFETYAPRIDETCCLPAADAVKELSMRKGKCAAGIFPDAFILAADTLVSVDGSPLGKPKDREDALHMLHLLSGRTHQVYTGVTVIAPDGNTFTEADRTDVTFLSLSDAEILSYVESGEPMDKAGSYALQGYAGLWICRICGCDSSVVGLPLYLVRKLLSLSGFPYFSSAGCNLVG